METDPVNGVTELAKEANAFLDEFSLTDISKIYQHQQSFSDQGQRLDIEGFIREPLPRDFIAGHPDLAELIGADSPFFDDLVYENTGESLELIVMYDPLVATIQDQRQNRSTRLSRGQEESKLRDAEAEIRAIRIRRNTIAFLARAGYFKQEEENGNDATA